MKVITGSACIRPFQTSASVSASVDIAIATSDIGRKSRIGRSLVSANNLMYFYSPGVTTVVCNH